MVGVLEEELFSQPCEEGNKLNKNRKILVQFVKICLLDLLITKAQLSWLIATGIVLLNIFPLA